MKRHNMLNGGPLSEEDANLKLVYYVKKMKALNASNKVYEIQNKILEWKEKYGDTISNKTQPSFIKLNNDLDYWIRKNQKHGGNLTKVNYIDEDENTESPENELSDEEPEAIHEFGTLLRNFRKRKFEKTKVRFPLEDLDALDAEPELENEEEKQPPTKKPKN